MSVGSILTLGFGNFGSVNLVPTLGYGESAPPTPVEIPQGGSGYPVWRKREPKTASNSLDRLWDLVAKEHYEAIVASSLPKSVKREAAAIVKPFASGRKAMPTVAQVDWQALDRDASAVAALLALWSDEIRQREIDADDEEILMMMN